jgi:hypothetical protein
MSKLSIAAAATTALGLWVLSPAASAAAFNGKSAAKLQKSASPGNAIQRVQAEVYRPRKAHVYRPYRVYRPWAYRTYRIVRPYVLATPAINGYYPAGDPGFGGTGFGYGGYPITYPRPYYNIPYYAGYPGNALP